MLADIKPTQLKMEELLSLGKQKPFDITVYMAAAFSILKVWEKRCGNDTKKQGVKNQEEELINEGDGKRALLHLGESVEPSENTPTNDDKYVANNK